MTENEQKLITFGEYPPELLRFFGKVKHARQFLFGRVRFGLLDYYKEIEDHARRDEDEGAGLVIAPEESVTTITVSGGSVTTSEAPGDVHHHTTMGNPTYILSCVDPRRANVDDLKERFGGHVVRITEPKALGQAITDKICQYDKTHPLAGAVVECVSVQYDKGDRRPTKQTRDQLTKAAYSQKPARFADEFEYRLVVFVRAPVRAAALDRYMTIDLGRPVECASLEYVDIVRSASGNKSKGC